MISISSIVQQIVDASAFAQEGMQRGQLNLSQFAKEIHRQVEKQSKKSVRVGTIIVALNRIQKRTRPLNLPDNFQAEDTYLYNNLIEYVIRKTPDTLATLPLLLKKSAQDPGGISITHGIHEFTIVAHQKYRETIHKKISKKDIVREIDNLSMITFTVPREYTDTPNIFYSLFRALAPHNINVIEIMSTSAEISIVVQKKDIDKILEVL